jgi:hypothetical protein
MVADELRRQADHFIELQDIASKISRSSPKPGTVPVETARQQGPTPAQPEFADEFVDVD